MIKYPNTTYGIPKDFLYVKLDPLINDTRREFISNELRGVFNDDLVIL